MLPQNRQSKMGLRIRRQRQGGTLVEFAIVVPFLILVLLGMMEFGRILTIQQNLTTAAREGAREATLPGATEDSVASVVNDYTNQMPTQNLQVTISPDLEDAKSGEVITVNVTAAANSMTGFGNRWFGGMGLSASAAMRKEGFE